MSSSVASAELAADRTTQDPRRLRIRVLPLGEKDVLAVEAVDTQLSDILDEAPDVMALTYGRTAVLTPLCAPVPGRGGCFHCLRRRWQLLRLNDERDVLEMQGGMQRQYDDPYLVGPASRFLQRAAEVVLGDGAWPTTAAGLTLVFEVRLDTGEVASYPLIVDADCFLCDLRIPDTPDAATVTLVSRPKPSRDATRVTGIHEYHLDTLAYANPVCGMLGRSARPALGSATTAPVTGYTRMRGEFYLHEFFWSGHADNFGDSELLGILEGLERHSGLRERRIVPSVVGKYAELAETALDPRSVGLYSDSFYKHKSGRFTPFTDELLIPWVWAFSLRDNRPVLVPRSFVYYGNTADYGTNFVMECSSGCATGGCHEEAILFGLLELVERDAFLNAWYGGASLPEIDANTCASAETRLMIDRLSLLGYDVRLFDNRVDLPIPSVTGVAVRRDGGLGTLCFAAGAALDPEHAVQAALCEIASYVPGFPERVRDNLDLVRAMQEDYTLVTELKHHALLYGAPEMAQHADFLLASDRHRRSMTDLYGGWEEERPRTDDFTDDLRYVLGVLVDRGFDVLTADQTSPEQCAVGLTTVATIVPGLIPIDFGWAMQRALLSPRLRIAAVTAGWRTEELELSDLNLHPHPFP